MVSVFFLFTTRVFFCNQVLKSYNYIILPKNDVIMSKMGFFCHRLVIGNNIGFI